MTYFKKLGAQVTVLASSIALVACGGGGGGYYGDNSTGGQPDNGNQATVKEASALVLTTFDSEGKSKNNISKSGDSLIIKLQAVDASGGGVAGKQVKLAITDFDKYGITSDGSTKTTDEQGYATFTVTVPKITAEIQKITLSGVIVGTSITQVSLIGVSGSTESIAQSILEAVFDPITAINVTGGTTVVRVRAKDINGGGVAGQKMLLAIPKELQDILSITGTSSVETDSNGYATFTIKLVNGKEVDRQNLINKGVLLSASLTDTEGAVATQNTILQIRSAIGLVDQVIFDTVLSNNKIAASNGSAQVAIKVLNPEGLPVKKQKVKLEIVDSTKVIDGLTYTDNAATHGANIIEPTVETDINGVATFNVTIAANDKNVQQTLAEWGVNLKATVVDPTNKTVIQQHKLTAVSNMNESVDKISFITQQLDITEGKGKVTLKAVDNYGGAVAGQNITLTISKTAELGVVSNSSSSLTTDAKGEVTFDLAFTKLNDEIVFKELMDKGITLSATHVNTKNQTILQQQVVKLTSQNNNTSSTVERLEITSDIGSVLATGNNKVKFTITAFNGDGTKAVNQRIGLGLNEVAVQNGVTFTSGQTVTTNNQGSAIFEINVNAQNLDAIKNLVSSGITLAANYKRIDGSAVSQLYRVAVLEPAITETLVSQLLLNPSDTSISSLGGETLIAVKAIDASGIGLEGKLITLGLPENVSSRVKLDNSTATTNKEGFAYFKVIVTAGSVDQDLVKSGITYAATTINSSDGTTKTQVNRLSVVVPQQALDVNLSTLKTSVSEAGENLDINIKVSSNDINVAGYPVTMEVVDGNLTGVKLDSINYSVDTNGNAKAVLIVPTNLTNEQRNKILSNGIDIKATITLPNGEKRGKILHVYVTEVINPNHLAITISKGSVVNSGDSALVTVKLLDDNNGGVANQVVKLKVAGNNAASINGNSALTTNQYGEAIFEIKLNQTTSLDIINLIATHTNTTNKTVTQTVNINVHAITALAPLLDLKFTASKPRLNLRGDATEVAVLVTNKDGAGISGKAVTLSIPGARGYISGPSTVESDDSGWAKFKVVLDEKLLTETDKAELLTNGLGLTGSVRDDNSTLISQITSLLVVQSEIPVTNGSISVNVNPTQIISSSDGVYYNWNGSVQVADLDGRPVANQTVTLDLRSVQFLKGNWAIAIDAISNNKVWAQNVTATCIVPTVDNPNTPYDDRLVTIKDNGKEEALNIIRFIGSDTSNPYTATYQTDREGKFDFQLHYPKAYGAWLNVEIGAKATMSNVLIRGTRTITLTTSSADFDKTDFSFTPSTNNQSPYGILGSCP